MSYIESYNDIRNIIKKFKKKGYWEVLSSADIFYIINGKKKALFTFVEQFLEDSFGMQLFNNDYGFNYVHDIFTLGEDTPFLIGDCDSICAVLTQKKDLTKAQIKFFKDNKIAIRENENLVMYRFEPSKGETMCSAKDLALFYQYLELIASVLNNDYDDILKSFKENNSVIIDMDYEALRYGIYYRPLPFLECPPRKIAINNYFIEEHKNDVYLNSECIICQSYLPLIIAENNVRPVLYMFYFPDLNRYEFRAIYDPLKEHKKLIFGVLDDVFEAVGTPFKISFTSRYTKSYLEKTLEELNIENDMVIATHEENDLLADVLSKIYQAVNGVVTTKREADIVVSTIIIETLNELDSEAKELLEDQSFIS